MQSLCSLHHSLTLHCYAMAVQNIDGLERIAGVPPEKLVEAHGSFFSAHCVNPDCKKQHDHDEIRGLSLSLSLSYISSFWTKSVISCNLIFLLMGSSFPLTFRGDNGWWNTSVRCLWGCCQARHRDVWGTPSSELLQTVLYGLCFGLFYHKARM